jgi:hypothetical protein
MILRSGAATFGQTTIAAEGCGIVGAHSRRTVAESFGTMPKVAEVGGVSVVRGYCDTTTSSATLGYTRRSEGACLIDDWESMV